MTVTRVHVNQAIIRRNHKTGGDEPVLTVKNGTSNRYAHEVEIMGPSRLVYAGAGSARKPLSCGARVWIETDAEVRLFGEVSHDSN